MVSILIIVMAKPMELVMVKAVPLISAGMAWATNVENCGESATTAIPHTHNNTKKTGNGKWKKSGESRQQPPEIINASEAVLALPILRERYPPPTQAIAPAPMIANDSSGTD